MKIDGDGFIKKTVGYLYWRLEKYLLCMLWVFVNVGTDVMVFWKCNLLMLLFFYKKEA